MAVKATFLTFFSSALLASGSGSDGFLAQGTSADESANPASIGVVKAELEQAERPQDAVEASNSNADQAASVDEDSLPEVGEVSAEEDNQEIPDRLVAFLEDLPLPAEAAGSDAIENVDVSGASGANCDTKRLKFLIKKVGYKLWHDCADPNPEICHRIDSALKDYMRKGGERAAKKNICRHQGDFKNAYKHNYDNCKKLADKAGKKGLRLPKSQKDLKHMCR